MAKLTQLWKTCGKNWGKVCGKGAKKFCGECGKESFTQKTVAKWEISTLEWKSFTRIFAQDFTEVEVWFYTVSTGLTITTTNYFN